MKSVNQAQALEAGYSAGADSRTSLQEKKALAYAKKGILLAFIAGMVFSMDGIMVQRSKGFAPFNDPRLWLLTPFICAGIHDCCAAILTTLVNWRSGRLREVGRSLASRPGRYVLTGAIFGALFGMGGYMMALQFAGPAYALPITSLYPAVAAVLAVFVLREKIPLRAWIGLALCIVGAIVIAYKPPASQGETTLFYVGLGCAALAAIGWGTEGVCATSGMDFIEPPVALNMYYVISGTLFLGILIPALSFIILPEIGGFSILLEFAQSKGIFFVALAGCIGSISYKCWYASMSMTGVSRAMAINISYALWGILFSYLFTDVEITRTLILGAIGIFIGMFLVIGNPRDMMDLRKTN